MNTKEILKYVEAIKGELVDVKARVELQKHILLK